MEHEVTYDFEDEEQFWILLEETISRECDSHDSIDDALRSYIDLIGSCRDRFLPTDHDLGRCALKLQDSSLFAAHADYIRRQFVHCLIEDEEPNVILVSTSFLIAHAQSTEQTYELLNQEGAFPRLVDLVSSPKQHGHEDIHRLLMELLYEMSRIQRITYDDMAHINDDFVKMLFEIIEQVSADVQDPYHYPTIRVLLVLNEQFMVAAHDPATPDEPAPLTNKVIKVLSSYGSAYKTFGENIILLLNREDETSLQLLTLKLLYLLFTTPPTYEYFYTNDLHVLVDILVRNLLDLPEEASSLRHTYLRVLYPLLEHTQLQQPPHYKRDEIRKLLVVLGGGHLVDQSGNQEDVQHWGHFDAVDETTKRLVKRCEGVSWLTDPDTEPPFQAESPTSEVASELSSPTSPSKSHPPALPAPRKLKKRNSTTTSILTIGQYLTPQLEGARKSSLSMMEVASQREKPGVITPSRNPGQKTNLRTAATPKERPPPPQARRSRFARSQVQRMESDVAIARADIPDAEAAAVHEAEAHQHHHRLPSLPFHHHGHGRSPSGASDSEKQKGKDKPPIPTHHRGLAFGKKPPPAPKARRWRGREGSGDSTREPGKFSSNLPSIVTSIPASQKVPDQSPFSPVEKASSPTEPDSVSIIDSHVKIPVREALEKAQAQALEEIEETLDHVEIKDDSLERVASGQQAPLPPLEEDAAEDSVRNDLSNPAIPSIRPPGTRRHTQDELDQPFHDAVTSQTLTPVHSLSLTPSIQAQSRPLTPQPTNTGLTTSPEMTVPSISTTMRTGTEDTSVNMDDMVQQTQLQQAMPRMVLTPPAQGPSRGVPGPQFEMERSPFLTDEEVDEGDGVETETTDEEEVEQEDKDEHEDEDSRVAEL